MPDAFANNQNITAILGPTNTGKTHLAIERMIAHSSGIIGLPLRLLAREVYSKIVARTGHDYVALITGEEKIVPQHPKYWVATVEAMPRDLNVAFVAIDEIQMAGDLARGHVFTDRILNVRGREETLLLGAATIKGLLEKLIPGLSIITRPRMSELTYAGSKKITRLPRRSAIVAFSTNDVYSIAELIRRQKGGAAVVLGALSPRTRNAQVELYQSGEVDYLVATDAIGMGLNLDVDHIAFAETHKFDGFHYRQLTAAEMGQIAGRAGRHTRDGTFGVTSQVLPLDNELVQKIESHAFEPLKVIQWRNHDLDFTNVKALQNSLEKTPQSHVLTRALPQDDVIVLETLLQNEEIKEHDLTQDKVRLLWETCQIPDYRKIAPAQHAEIVTSVYKFLANEGTLSEDWFSNQIKQAKQIEGNIDILSTRIAHIRTWTFIANHAGWLDNAVYWQEQTRDIENHLSDALHEKLIERFVSRRTSVLMRRMRENTMLEAEIMPDGDVRVEGQHVGWLHGFRFSPDQTAEGLDAKAVRNGATKALAGEITKRAEKLNKSVDTAFLLSSDGTIRWNGEVVAKLIATEQLLKPNLILLADEQLTGEIRTQVEARLKLWLESHISTHLKPLMDLEQATHLEPLQRGLAFRLFEKLGAIDRREVAEEVRNLNQEARAGLRKQGVRFGAYNIFMPALLKPAPSALLALLWNLKNGNLEENNIAELSQLSASGRTSIPVEKEVTPELYPIAGFRILGSRAVRIDILERLADQIRPLVSFDTKHETPTSPPEGAAEGNAFTVTVAMTSLLGCAGDDFASVLQALGYRREKRQLPQKDSAVSVEANKQEGEPANAGNDEPFEKITEEPAFIELWRPGRIERKQPKKTNQPHIRANENNKTPTHSKKQKHKKAAAIAANKKPSKSVKKIDPDSPFAALAALKTAMKK
jgi:ATP-dependent RNA helicase SUPV3L1/SUV3